MGNSRNSTIRASVAILALVALAGCDDQGQFILGQGSGSTAGSTTAETGETTERDVEAPEVFSVTEAGLWDGRPSLGGVWVAHPDVKDPERVIIRNTGSGKFVVGALFRRERDIPGPRLQISSDAAEALGMIAGSPSELSVIALRRETVPVAPPPTAPVEAETVEAPAEVSAAPLDPITATAEAAINNSAASETATAATPAPKPAPKPVSRLSKPYIQVGIFSVKANAEGTASQMRNAGMVPTVRSFQTGGKTFWRVIVGPAQTSSERATLLKTIKGVGFTDAYAVTN